MIFLDEKPTSFFETNHRNAKIVSLKKKRKFNFVCTLKYNHQNLLNLLMQF